MNFFKRKRKPVSVSTRTHDLRAMQNRIAGMSVDDPLWPMLLGLVRNNLEIETDAIAQSGIGDEEAHRARGRIGMLLDLEAQLKGVWIDAHTPPATE